MSKNKIILVCVASLASSLPSNARAEQQWGIETELVQPFVPTVRIFQVRATRTMWGSFGASRGDLIVGAYGRPNINHDVVKKISEYMGEIGYRQYVWKGLHADALVLAGTASGTNKFDDKKYNPTTLFASANIGYRVDFLSAGGLYASNSSSVGFYVAAQFGVLGSLRGLGVDVNNIGPRNGKPDVFLQGNLLVGVAF
jgi:hypothetical protein